MPKLARVGVVCANVLKEVPDPDACDLATLERLVGSNTGNLAFSYPVDLLLDNPIERIPWNFDIAKARERYDVLWFACANMIGPHVNLNWVSDHLAKASIPVVAVGLGAQSRSTNTYLLPVPEGTLKWLKTLQSLSPSEINIFCRGDYTDSLLKERGISNSIAGCCPSLFISPALSLGSAILGNRQEVEVNRRPIAVYSGFIGNTSLYQLERSLIRLVDQGEPSGIYISQHGSTLLGLSEPRLRDTLRPEDILKAKEMILPEASHEEFLQWCNQYMKAFYSLDKWVDELKGCSFSCGMRFHGNMIALQAGIPSLCVTIDSRTEEMCASCQAPSFKANEFTSVNKDLLYQIFDSRFNAKQFDSNRSLKARQLAAFLLANGLSPSHHLRSIANALGEH